MGGQDRKHHYSLKTIYEIHEIFPFYKQKIKIDVLRKLNKLQGKICKQVDILIDISDRNNNLRKFLEMKRISEIKNSIED